MISAFCIGLLNSVFLGIAISTFIFVAAFFRSGVVKFLSNGITVRSTIQRQIDAGGWLDENGDLIQILVLQNYLFFGNASSIFSYISSMFEDPKEDQELDFELPPFPKYIIIDLTLVTGMDTSTVDVFKDIETLCTNQECKLFISGLSQASRQTLTMGGFKPDPKVERSKRVVRYFMDLDAAIGKAEDSLLDEDKPQTIPRKPSGADLLRRRTSDENSLGRALHAIDEQVRNGKKCVPSSVNLHNFFLTLALLLIARKELCRWIVGSPCVHNTGLS